MFSKRYLKKFSVSSKIAYSLLLRAGSIFSSFLLSWIIAKELNISDAGIMLFFLSISSIFVTLSVMGYDIAIAKVSANNVKSSTLLGYFYFSLKKVLITCLLLITFIYIYIIFFTDYSSGYNNFLLLLCLLVFFISQSVMHILSYMYQGLGMLAKTVLSQRTLFNFLFCILFSLIIWLLYSPTKGVVLFTMALSAFLSLLLMLLSSLNFFSSKSLEPDLKSDTFYSFNRLRKNAFPVAIVQLLSMYMVQLLLFILAPSDEFAGYIVVVRISSLLAVAILAASNVVMPKFVVSFNESDRDKFDAAYNESIKFSLILGVPLSLVIFFGGDIVLSLFGDEYINFYWALVILTVSQLFNCVTGTSDVALTYIGGDAVHKRNVIFGMVVCLILSILLVPKFLAIGAALSASTSAILVNVLDYIYIQKFRKHMASSLN